MKITNKLKLPKSIVEAIKAVRNEYDSGGSYVSASSITLPPRIFHLKKRYKDKIEQDASDLIWSLLGTIVHSLLEKGENQDEIVEERLYKEIHGKKFSGQYDNFDLKSGTLTDYKFSSVYVATAPIKFEYEAQQNALRLLLHEAGYEVKRLSLAYILRDWSKAKSKVQKNYPQRQVMKVRVPMWTLEETEQFLLDRVNLLIEHEETPDDELPVCSKKDRWEDDDIWAVYKDKKAKRALKLHKDEIDAKVHLAKLPEGHIELRKSEPRRCNDYCEVNQFCSFFKERDK